MDPSSGPSAGSINKGELKTQELLVGAPRFELGTSCAQGRRKALANSLAFSQQVENPIFSGHLGMWVDVSGCGWKLVGSLQKSLHWLNSMIEEKNANE